MKEETMLDNLFKLLKVLPAYNVCEEIEIAKGRYSIPKTFKDVLIKAIRDIKYNKK